MKGRLYAAFALVAVLIACAAGYTLHSFDRYSDGVARVSSRALPEVVAALRLSERTALLAARSGSLVHAGSEGEVETISRRLDALLAAIDAEVSVLTRLGSEAADVGLVQEQRARVEANIAALKQAALARINLAASRRLVQEDLRKVQARLNDTIEPVVYGSASLTRLFGRRAARRIGSDVERAVNSQWAALAGLIAVQTHVADLGALVMVPTAVRSDAEARRCTQAVEAARRGLDGLRHQVADGPALPGLQRAASILASGVPCASATAASAASLREMADEIDRMAAAVRRQVETLLADSLQRTRGSISDVVEQAITDLNYATAIKAEGNLMLSLLNAATVTGDIGAVSPLRNAYARSLSAFRDGVAAFRDSALSQRNPILATNVYAIESRMVYFLEEANLFALRRAELRQEARLAELAARTAEAAGSMTVLIDGLTGSVMRRVAEVRDGLESAGRTSRFLLMAIFAISLGATGVIAKITVDALRERERALSEAKEEAETASRAKSEFLASMSHELRTPLNAVIGFSDMVRNEVFGPLGDRHYVDYMENIHQSGNHLLDLINDILDVSRIEAGRLALDEEEVDLRQLAESALRLVQARADNGKVSLSADIPSGLPRVRGDTRRLKQVVINFLSNAVKFTPPGGEVRLVAAFRTSGEVIVTVRDTGIGMAPGDIQKALEPFGQVDSRLARRYEGTGLGLPLSIGLIHLHGGRFDIDSTPGEGTTVRFSLPGDRVITPSPPSASAA